MSNVINLFTFGNYDPDAHSAETGFRCEGESSALQQFKEECDINTIVKRFGLTGEMPANLGMPVSGDFSGVVDFHSAMNLVVQATEAFESLPADLRKQFHHDPGELIAFLEDPGNREQAEKLGLVNKPPEQTRDKAPAVAPPSPPEPPPPPAAA